MRKIFIGIMLYSSSALCCPDFSGEYLCKDIHPALPNGSQSSAVTVVQTSVRYCEQILLEDGSINEEVFIIDGQKHKAPFFTKYRGICSENKIEIKLRSLFVKAEIEFVPTADGFAKYRRESSRAPFELYEVCTRN